MRFEIVVTDEPFDQEQGALWEAAVYPIADDGESGDLVAAGTGKSRTHAVVDALSAWGEEGD